MSIIGVWDSSFKMAGEYTILAGIGILLDTRGMLHWTRIVRWPDFFSWTENVFTSASLTTLWEVKDTLYQPRL